MSIAYDLSYPQLSINYEEAFQVQLSDRTSLTNIAPLHTLLYTRNKHASALCVEINTNPRRIMRM